MSNENRHEDSGATASSLHIEMIKSVETKTLLDAAIRNAYDYIDTKDHRSVFPTPQAVANLSVFDELLPEHRSSLDDASDILEQLHEFGAPATVVSTGGRYFGFVNGNIVPTGLAARWMADVWDQNSALYKMSPIAAQLERVAEKWCVDLLGLPKESTRMGLVGGTSVANVCALAAARNTLLHRQGWNVNKQGLFGAPEIRVVVSEEAHGCVGKALALIGLGSDRVVKVPADDQGRICVNSIPTLDDRTIIILQAGHVSTGAFDDFVGVCERTNGAWVHVDGAFGLWAAASKNLKHLTTGLSQADSWTVDGHKTLNTPYDCGICLVRDGNALAQAMEASGAYLNTGGDERCRDGMFFTPDMSRRARSIELWATLKYLGREGVEQLMESMVVRAQEFGELFKETPGFHVLNDIVFNQCLIRCNNPTETLAILDLVQSSGELWCGGTQWQNEPAIRISICSWSTSSDDVKRSVQAFVAAQTALSRSRALEPCT